MPLGVWAQVFTPNPDWQFQNYNSQNHFISREIADVAIDKHGYVWVSSSGVQRFDGYRTLDFNTFDDDNGGLKSNTADVIADEIGRIWVGSDGLCFYNDTSGRFNYVGAGARYPLKYAYCFWAQKQCLWLNCAYGLAKVDLQSLKVSFTSLTTVTDALCTRPINDSTLLVSSRQRVYIYNIPKDTYKAYTFIYDHALVKIFTVKNSGNDIFLGTNRGLFMLKNMNEVVLADEQLKDIEISDLFFLPADKQKKYLFVATQGNGLLVWNTVLKKVEFAYTHDDNNPYSLPSNIVNKCVSDKNGKLWISTAVGLSMLDITNQQWKMRLLKTPLSDEFYINKVAIDKYDSTRVWMLSFTQGMVSVDWKTKRIEKIYNQGLDALKLYDFEQLSKSKWLLVTQKKVIEWDTRLGILTEKKLPVSDSLALVYNIRTIIRADAKTCFLNTNRGLFKYDLPSHAITVAAQNNKSKKIEDLQYDLQRGFYDNGILWIASRGGLFSYDIAQNKVIIYRGKGVLDDYFFFDCVTAPYNQVICASGGGITLFNKQTKQFKVINTIAGLNHPDCENVICTGDKVWIKTEPGILNYDLVTHQSVRAELQTPLVQIFPGSPFTFINKDIVIGFRNGYAYFSPDLKNILMPSDPVIEKIYVNNQPLLKDHDDQTGKQRSVFRYFDNSINIAFTAFLYSDPDHINFRYKLKGADPDWQYTHDERGANYAQLKPGDYTFYVQSGNKNGVWNNSPAVFSFVIEPPYWATWWFRLAIVVGIAFVLYRLYLYQIKHIKAIVSIRESIAADFHDDLGSTLSSISIFSQVAMQKAETDLPAAQTMVADIGMRARAMIHSMNDMVWAIKPENDNLYRLMQRMEEFSYPVAEAKDVQIVFLMDKSLFDIKTDMLRRKNLFLIFKEAFNNAIKYSGANKIEVRFDIKQKKTLVMCVTDNGSGFDLGQIKRGNGLGNMQKRATEIKGTLKVVTSPGAGTSINIFCRIT